MELRYEEIDKLFKSYLNTNTISNFVSETKGKYPLSEDELRLIYKVIDRAEEEWLSSGDKND